MWASIFSIKIQTLHNHVENSFTNNYGVDALHNMWLTCSCVQMELYLLKCLLVVMVPYSQMGTSSYLHFRHMNLSEGHSLPRLHYLH